MTFRRNGSEGLVEVSASRLPTSIGPQALSCPDSALHPRSSCTTKNYRGAKLTSDDSPVDETRPTAARRLTTVLTYPDGRQLAISVSNAPAAPPAPAKRNSPHRSPSLPLTRQELAAIAGSPAWKPILAELPPPEHRPAPDIDQSMPAKRITRVIAATLPRGVRVADVSGQPGYGHLTVDDGQGKCLIAVTVQRWRPADPTIGKVFNNAREFADGTLVMTGTGPATNGGRGALEWRADSLRPDGLRVLATEVNARAYQLPGTRRTPVLSPAHLAELVRSDAWRRA
ncbi:hypothetical protein [Streptomyces sp. NPDC016845]|uniref:hypothetical protein n=1 Tax=Streptomyces sp. NPDC016845 TaxID=3364972 RepID=UPI0037BB2EDF